MVDHESEKYRPRRAFIEPAAAADADPEPGPGTAHPPAGRPAHSDPDEEDAPKPLFRDESPAGPPAAGGTDPGRTPDRPRADDGVDDDGGSPDEGDSPAERTRRITFTRRPGVPAEEDDGATTILPRVRGGRRPPPDDDLDDLDDLDDDHRPLSQRTRLILLVGAVAAVVVIGIAIGYAVLGVGNRSADPGGNPTPAASDSPTGPTDEPAGTVLSEASMLSPAQARVIDGKRTWSVALSQRGDSADAPQPACFGGDPVEGEPTPQQKIVDVLGSSGKSPPSVLHVASAYGSPEEAAQAFAVASKTLGGCAVAGSYLSSGRVVSGIGDQAVGVIAVVQTGAKGQSHSVLVARTGRVLDVLDATQPTGEVRMDSVAKALASVVGVQCTAAAGSCDASPLVKPGPPPLGGDTPGFLAYGDLPPAGPKPAPWVATPVELPQEDFVGSGCESVNWSTVPAVGRSARVYLVQDSGKSLFGLNEIVLTEKDEQAAAKLVDKVRSDLERCKKVKLTATVSKPDKLAGLGARNTPVTGWSATVTQKTARGELTYRVGMVKAGAKVAYTFLTPEDDFDLTQGEWRMVTVRAGQRTTQVN